MTPGRDQRYFPGVLVTIRQGVVYVELQADADRRKRERLAQVIGIYWKLEPYGA